MGRRLVDKGWNTARTLVLALLVAMGMALPAFAQGGLMPAGFFDQAPPGAHAKAHVSADTLTFNQQTQTISADGHVTFTYDGYKATGDHLIFYQRTRAARMIGNVVMHDKTGTVYTTPELTLPPGMRHALLKSLTIRTPSGALVTADDGDYSNALQSVLVNATYSPCGKCIGKNGARIGWQVKATRMIYHNASKTVTLVKPSLYLLGFPVAWLPFLSMPDPTQPRQSGFRLPSADSGATTGVGLTVPYFQAVGEDTDLIFTPTLLARQGFLLGAQWDQRFPGGAFSVKTSGLYQLDPSAFKGQVGDRRWRGALQASGQFVPAKDWTVGWSYTAFTDAAYLLDYRVRQPRDDDVTNEVYATRLTRSDYFDIRAQQFNELGDYSSVAAQDLAQDQQAQTLPNARYDKVIPLGGERGEIDVTARLLGTNRGADSTTSPNGVTYQLGYAETKAHAMVQVGWQKQWIGGTGLVTTPYLGVRADTAYVDGADSTLDQRTLYNATPIAAMDFRFPMIAREGTTTQLVEPIAQLVYRASAETDVGITNDDAQSFVFQDTNLFSYNRFSGADRQETGLRANIGAHYQINYGAGHWIDLVGGQSYQLAGANAFADPDGPLTGLGSGLGSAASYLVLGATASPLSGLNLGGKIQLDPTDYSVTRSGVGGTYAINGYNFGANYFYVAANPERGVVKDQEELAGEVSVPLMDYWRASTGAAWDMASNTFLEAHAALNYDDGYLTYGGQISRTGSTNVDPNDLRYTVTIRLKGPNGTYL